MSEKLFNQPLEDEISFIEVINFFVESWKVIALSAIVATLISAGYIFISHPKYKATTSIQVAMVAGNDVEAPEVLIEKLKMPLFYTVKSFSSCGLGDNFESGEVISDNLKIDFSKPSGIIRLSYMGNSTDFARKCLEGILNDIRSAQNLLAKSMVDGKKRQLLALKQKFDATEKIVKGLSSKDKNFNFTDSQFSASALLLATSMAKDNELKELGFQINELENSLSDAQTRELSVLSPVYASNVKVSPKNFSIIIVGLMAGLFLGILFSIGKRSWLAYKVSNQ